MKNYINLNSKRDLDLIKVSLMDNGYWEYNRMGVGEVEGKVFIVDLDDDGESKKKIEYVKEGLSIEDVLKIGVEVGVIEEIDWGYDEDDKFRVIEDCDMKDWKKFDKKVF